MNNVDNRTSKENGFAYAFFLKVSPFSLKWTKGTKNKRENSTFTETKKGP